MRNKTNTAIKKQTKMSFENEIRESQKCAKGYGERKTFWMPKRINIGLRNDYDDIIVMVFVAGKLNNLL